MSKKILIVVGTRPNFIKITQFEKEFKAYGSDFEYVLLHTGQHYDENMSDVFFRQFKLKKPDYFLNVKQQSPATQIGNIIIELDKILVDENPDLVIVVGDVNSTLAAAVAANKNNVKIAHLESGLRSFYRDMPEEVNRVLTDEIADLFFVTEQSGIDHLTEEGKDESKIHFVGNTMIDTLVAFDDQIQQDDILEQLGLEKGKYALTTMHRPRNVDNKEGLETLVSIINSITSKLKLVFPIHPRTRKNLELFGLVDEIQNKDQLIFTAAMNYISFQKLITDALFVITDSGGIQEETTYRQIPCLTLRPSTERPSTVDIGSNTLVEYNVEDANKYIDQIIDGNYKKGNIPPLWDGQATKRIVKILKDIL